MMKKKVLSALLLSTIVLGSVAPTVYATDESMEAAPTAELVTEAPASQAQVTQEVVEAEAPVAVLAAPSNTGEVSDPQDDTSNKNWVTIEYWGNDPDDEEWSSVINYLDREYVSISPGETYWASPKEFAGYRLDSATFELGATLQYIRNITDFPYPIEYEVGGSSFGNRLYFLYVPDKETTDTQTTEAPATTTEELVVTTEDSAAATEDAGVTTEESSVTTEEAVTTTEASADLDSKDGDGKSSEAKAKDDKSQAKDADKVANQTKAPAKSEKAAQKSNNAKKTNLPETGERSNLTTLLTGLSVLTLALLATVLPGLKKKN